MIGVGAIGTDWQRTDRRIPFWGQRVEVRRENETAIRILGQLHDVHCEEVPVWMDEQGKVVGGYWPEWKPIPVEES